MPETKLVGKGKESGGNNEQGISDAEVGWGMPCGYGLLNLILNYHNDQRHLRPSSAYRTRIKELNFKERRWR